MARGVNKVTLVGNLGNDPEVKYTQSGACITRISLATTHAWKDKDGNQQEKTEWHRVVFFGKLAEIAGEYLRKGGQVYVEGRLSYGSYEHQDGHTVYTTDIIGDEMQMLGGRRDDDGGGQRQGGQQQRQAPRQEYGGGGGGGYGQQRQGSDYGQQRGGNNAGKPAGGQQSAPPMDDFADDDIPF